MDTDPLKQAGLPVFASATNSKLDAARRAADAGSPEETARQFEALFATALVREMRRAVPGGLFGDGPGADVFEGWFDENLGQALSQREALGIGQMVKTSLLRKQAAQAAQAAQAEMEGKP